MGSSIRRHNEMGSLWTQLLFNFFYPIFLKLCRCFCHGLKMYIWFWGYPPEIFINFFHFFNLVFFTGQIRIDTLWAQLLLEFSTDHFETMHTCSTWSVDAHVLLGLFSFYFYQLFPLFQLSFFSRFNY